MATTYTTKVGIPKPAAGDRTWDVPILAGLNLLDTLGSIGPLAVQQTEYPSSTRNVKVAAGSYRKADGTVATYAGTASFTVTASGTRLLYLTDAGTLTDATSWPAADHVRLATVVTGASTLTSVTDARIPWTSFGVGGGSFLPLSGGTLAGNLTFADAVNIVVNTTTGTKIGTSVSQKIGFFNVTPVIQPLGASQTALTDSTGGSVANAILGDGVTSTALTISTGGSVSGTLNAMVLPTALTGSTGGSADGAWQTIPSPTDSPASADALRDDIETNVLAAIRNNFEETKTEIATIRASLSTVRDAITTLATQCNLFTTDTTTGNDNDAKIAVLVTAIRTGLVALGLLKGSA